MATLLHQLWRQDFHQDTHPQDTAPHENIDGFISSRICGRTPYHRQWTCCHQPSGPLRVLQAQICWYPLGPGIGLWQDTSGIPGGGFDRFGLPQQVIHCIVGLFFSTNISLNNNGYIYNSIAQGRGPQRRDPLSHLLINLAY